MRCCRRCSPSLRLPFTLITGFLLCLFADAAALLLADEALPDQFHVDGPGDALLAALVMTAVSLVLEVIAGTNDDDEYMLRVIKRVASRQGTPDADGRSGHPLPRDRRPRPADAAQRDP